MKVLMVSPGGSTPALGLPVVAQAVSAAVFPLDAVSGVLFFGLATGLVGLLTQLAILTAGRTEPFLVNFERTATP